MLQLSQLTLRPPAPPGAPAAPLLAEVTTHVPTRGHFMAVLGPSGCGKSTLLKLIAGLLEPTSGTLHWEGRDLTEHDLQPGEIGYVPQFSVLHEQLTTAETLATAAQLRLGSTDADATASLQQTLADETGLTPFLDRRVAVLSGGQCRRLALALEVLASPRLLLCDEVTSGLDPKAEDEIAHLLQRLSRTPEPRLVISVTHSLRHLSLCDSVLVLHQGHLAYHGPPAHLFHYFQVERHEELFTRLADRPPEAWHASWQKHGPAYYEEAGWSAPESEPPSAPAHLPGAITQWWVALHRCWRLFWRDRAQVALHLALLFGFPCLVVIFALDGLPQLQSMAAPSLGNALEQVKDEFSRQAEQSRVGSLVSGLIMFQVILLALVASNNAARQIAAERAILEQEKFAGLRPGSYVAAKAAFLAVLVLAQSAWMTLFVDWVVRFPGSAWDRFLLLTSVNAAVTSICLAISSLLRTPEQASLVSIYLVGLQLPLSGAVLALPSAFSTLVRPFIAAFWGWSGVIHTLRETRFYDAILAVTATKLAPLPLCLWLLLSHLGLGLYITWIGVRRARWP